MNIFIFCRNHLDLLAITPQSVPRKFPRQLLRPYHYALPPSASMSTPSTKKERLAQSSGRFEVAMHSDSATKKVTLQAKLSAPTTYAWHSTLPFVPLSLPLLQ